MSTPEPNAHTDHLKSVEDKAEASFPRYLPDEASDLVLTWREIAFLQGIFDVLVTDDPTGGAIRDKVAAKFKDLTS